MQRSQPIVTCVLFALAVTAAGCPSDVDTNAPNNGTTGEGEGEATDIPQAPIRRLSQAELNRTLRDLFDGITIPFVALSDGQPPAGSGAKFDADVARQTPSDLVIEQLRAGAIAVTAAAITRKDLLLPRQPNMADLDDQRAVGRELVAAFGPRALRRPFEGDEQQRYSAFFDQELDAEGFDVAVQVVLQAFLMAPSFLYRVEIQGGPVDDDGQQDVRGYEMASRLSYFLWGTMPDPTLFERAEDGSLDDVDALEDEARRMLADAKAQDGVLAFHRQWLDLDRITATNKDAASHPSYNEFLRQSMRTEADLFISSVIFGGDAKLETLFTSTTAPVNNSLAGLYGVPLPNPPENGGAFQFVELPADQRAGIITQAQFLAARAHEIEPSPVLRGVYVLERFLCESPPAPDGSIDTTPPERDPNVQTTNRQRFAQHTFDPVCQACHEGIDGIGMGLEGYNAIGQFRTTDNGLPVDDSGSLEATQVGGTFNGGPGLARLLADSKSVRACVARHWFRHSLGRHEEQLDEANYRGVRDEFESSGGNITELLVSIVRSPAFRVRPAIGGAP
jgi:hypothetical protein